MYRKPLTMHEISLCRGRRVACDSRCSRCRWLRFARRIK